MAKLPAPEVNAPKVNPPKVNVKREARADLFARYKNVFKDAWSRRHDMTPLIRKQHEAEFLPATLALQETPVHPAPRVFMWLIIGFAVLLVLWSCFGRIDVVATATGKIVPDSRSKVIQPLEVAAVRAIHVRDGQAVKAGDILIELDSSSTQADMDRFAGEQRAAALDILRYSALTEVQSQLEKINSRTTINKKDKTLQPELKNFPDGINQLDIDAEQRWVNSLFAAYVTRLSQLSASIVRREADYRATESVVAKYKETVPIIKQRETDYSDLLEKKFIAKHEYLNLKAQLIEQEKDYVTQQERLAEIAASRSEAEREREQFIAEQRREWLDKLHDAQQREAIVAQELKKAQMRNRFMRLTAPVDGVVQQLSVHSLNGVVTPAQVLMVIVPQDSQIEVEAVLPNKDIGFVRMDQAVEVKFDTFSFTKYGTVKGKVLSVSSDAIQDEKLGLVFSVRVGLAQDYIVVEGNPIRLSPGMAASVEIKTTQRRVIEYFLDPLMRHTSESLRER